MSTQPQRPDHDPTAPASAGAAGDLQLGDLLDLSRLIVAEGIDVIAGDPPVPISVWRLAYAAHRPGGGHDPAGAFTPGLAAPLVATFSRPGQTILDLNHDAAIQGAAGAGARRYRTVTDPRNLDELAGSEHLAGAVDLVVSRWPHPDPHPTDTQDRTDGTSGPDAAADLFTACRTLLAPDGLTVLVLAPPPPGPPYVEHAQVVIPAAHHAGLGYLQHIIVVTAPIAGEPTPRLASPADGATLRAATHIRAHLDLLVFVLRPTAGSRGRSARRRPDRPGRAPRRAPRSTR